MALYGFSVNLSGGFRTRLAMAGFAFGMTMSAVAQSGTPEPMAPLKQHDGRVGAVLETLEKTRTPSAAAISPDGVSVAWTVRGQRGSELHITALATGGSAKNGAVDRGISPDTIGSATTGQAGVCSGSSPVWSPDGKALAFLSGCTQKDGRWQADGQSEIFVWTLAGNGMKQATHVTGTIDEMAWSPDGKAIGFLSVENAPRA